MINSDKKANYLQYKKDTEGTYAPTLQNEKEKIKYRSNFRFEKINGIVYLISTEENNKNLYQFDLNLYLHHIKILSKKYNYDNSELLKLWIDENYPSMIKLEIFAKERGIK
jgi:hypothetical protein